MLIHTRCPLDDSDSSDIELYPANFDPANVTPETFSARRLPDRIHYRMVRNTRTRCVRADPILDEATVAALYRASKVTYEPVAEFSAGTYAAYVQRALPHLPDRRGVLEVGCGHGFFLVRLAELGFEKVAGVEPAADAVEKAAPDVRPLIVEGTLKPELFEEGSFSLICGFQVLDHLADPNEALRVCLDLLSPGGVTLWICHDVGAWLARVLGERCPIVDIQHPVLYDRKTLSLLFERNGYEILEVFGVANRYPLQYWASLAPAPKALKAAALALLKATRLGTVPLSARLGNMGILARKPAQDRKMDA